MRTDRFVGTPFKIRWYGECLIPCVIVDNLSPLTASTLQDACEFLLRPAVESLSRLTSGRQSAGNIIMMRIFYHSRIPKENIKEGPYRSPNAFLLLTKSSTFCSCGVVDESNRKPPTHHVCACLAYWRIPVHPVAVLTCVILLIHTRGFRRFL